MKKENLIAQLEGAKALTSVVSIDNVIALIQSLEPEVKVEKVFGITEELAEEIQDRIERILDYNSNDIADLSSAEFELSYDNRIELNSVDINVYDVMRHISAVFNEFIVEEDDEEDGVLRDADEDDGCGPSEADIMQSVNDGLGTQSEE